MSENIFNQMAGRYENEERVALARVIAGELNSYMKDEAGVLLDYGCGTGLIGLPFTSRFDRVILADASEEMVGITKEKIENNKITNAEATVWDITDGKRNIKADVIVISLVMLHVGDTETLLGNLFDVLNEDGTLYIVDFDKNESISHPKVHNGFDQAALGSMLQSIGYRNIDINTFYHGKEIFMKKDASLFAARADK